MSEETPRNDTYTHGHHSIVLRSHSARTAENSAAYLLHLLRADSSLLDVGCGPGSITLDFAKRAPSGDVVGVERSETAIQAAQAAAAAQGITNAHFVLGDVYALDFADDSFDIVHAHQVLQHLSDPVAALREMGRVCRPGGVVAVLGRTGVNFGAGFTGGFAYVLDLDRNFVDRYNHELIDIHRITPEGMQSNLQHLQQLITRHVEETGSVWGAEILRDFRSYIGSFWVVKPKAASLESLIENLSRAA